MNFSDYQKLTRAGSVRSMQFVDGAVELEFENGLRIRPLPQMTFELKEPEPQCEAPNLERDQFGRLKKEFGGHLYDDHDGTEDCKRGCGAWVGPYRSGGPDPFGRCPKFAKRKKPEPPAAADDIQINIIEPAAKPEPGCTCGISVKPCPIHKTVKREEPF